MAKLLKPKDRLRLVLASLEDLFEEIVDLGGLISASYQQVYGFFPSKYKKHNFTHLVWRSLKTKEIKKVKINGIPHLRLTSQGKKKLIRDFPFLFFQKKPWDGFFTQCSYDIEEINKRTRDLWRAKIKELNFGRLQKSVYISPFDFSQDLWEFVTQRRLEGKVCVARVKFIGRDPKRIASQAWPLKKIAKAYQKLIDNFKKRLKNKEVSENDKKEFLSQYLNLLFEDPHLPSELLPQDWPGFAAQKLAQQVARSLAINY